jgi:hypothetical protein
MPETAEQKTARETEAKRNQTDVANRKVATDINNTTDTRSDLDRANDSSFASREFVNDPTLNDPTHNHPGSYRDLDNPTLNDPAHADSYRHGNDMRVDDRTGFRGNDPRANPQHPQFDPNYASRANNNRNDPNHADYDAAYAASNPRFTLGSTLNRPQLSVVNEFKMNMDKLFTTISTDITNYRQNGAQSHHFSGLQERITQARLAVQNLFV